LKMCYSVIVFRGYSILCQLIMWDALVISIIALVCHNTITLKHYSTITLEYMSTRTPEHTNP